MRLILVLALMSTTVVAQHSLFQRLTGQGEKKPAEPAPQDPLANDLCATPQSALKTFFYGDNDKVLECFDNSTRTRSQLAILASRLMKVLRANGVVLDINSVPNDENYKEPNTSKSRYLLSNRLKSIYLERTNVGWIFPNVVIDTIDGLYTEAMRVNLGSIYQMVPDWATVDIFGIDGFSLVQVFFLLMLVLAGLVVRLLVIALINHQVGKIFERHGMLEFEKHLLRASSHIANLIMALLLLAFIPGLDLNVHLTSYLLIVARLGAGISVVMLAYRSVDLITHYALQKALTTASKLDDQLVPLFGRGLKIVVCIIGFIFVLQNLDVDVTGLLAGVTIGGLAFSFAAKDTVANLFGSITIFADKPFLVGDWIKAADVEGIVEQVGFRSTRIRTFYNSLITVPNSKFTESVVDNMGARRYRRTDTKLLIPLDSDPNKIEVLCNGIRAIISAHPKTRKDAYEVHLSEFAEFSLKVMVFFFTEVETNSQEFRCRHEIYLDILRLAHKIGMRFAIPTQSIQIDRMATAKDAEPFLEPRLEELNTSVEFFAPKGEGVIPPGPRVGKPYFSTQLPESAYK